uniref:Wsv343-like protein n=1 Tax=Pasiphaea japonica whispovirus TaxID=2984286 RepID=A0A9C7CEZ7_9VIRU|nr:MAG: wsv343-like protein [Pasiphaea japonica whispovirus]
MFQADILNMKGGKMKDADVREYLSSCADNMIDNPSTIKLTLSKCIPKYDNRRVPLVILDTDFAVSGNHNIDEKSCEVFSSHRELDNNNPLTTQLGHLTVKDAIGNGDYNKNNLLYSGVFVVEYDLVGRDKNGKLLMYSEPPLLEEVANQKRTGVYKKHIVPSNTGNAFMDKLQERNSASLNNRMDEEGPHVSTGKLLKDIMVLIKLFTEETSLVEKKYIAPTWRKLLSWTDKPMFRVSFLSNLALMGLKVVFHPTVLEVDNTVTTKTDILEMKALLKMQLELLGKAIPEIVNNVTEQSKENVFCFEIDVDGSSNWNLPGHCKNDIAAFPYHHTHLVTASKSNNYNYSYLEITNQKLVTSLGVVPVKKTHKWMYGFLGDFFRKTTYIEKLTNSLCVSKKDEWRNDILFSELGPEMPFRNKSLVMDLDFFSAGMCYKFLAQGGGLLLTKQFHQTNKEKYDKTSSGLDDPSTNTWKKDGGNGSNDDAVNDKGDEASKKDPPVPPVPTDIPLMATAAYDNIIFNNEKILIITLINKHGFIMGDHTMAVGLAMRFLMAIKKNAAEKKTCLEALTDNVKNKIKIIVESDKLNFDIVLPIAILQLVLRYELRCLQLPRDTPLLVKNLNKRKWSQLVNFETIWAFAYREASNPPTEEQLTACQPPSPPPSPEQQPSSSSAMSENNSHDNLNCTKGNKNKTEGMESIQKLLSVISSSFATGADSNDTMFAWTVVTLAERFCALYNALTHSEEFYRQMVEENGKYFNGCLENFKEMCFVIREELDFFIPENKKMVCKMGVKGYENAVERIKNMTNNKVCKIKLEELKMVYGLNNSNCYSFDNDNNNVNQMDTYALNDAFEALFKTVIEDKQLAIQTSNIEDEDFDDDEEMLDNDDILQKRLNVCNDNETNNTNQNGDIDMFENQTKKVISDFFNDVRFTRSFQFRSALCHRQKYVSSPIVENLENGLCSIMTIGCQLRKKKCKQEQLDEIRRRNKMMNSWVVPFSMPTGYILESTQDDDCSCLAINDTNKKYSAGSAVKKKCMKLLTIPSSKHLRDLTVALRFNTMSCERRYFSDVSLALGFTNEQPEPRRKIEGIEQRWVAIEKFKIEGSFLACTNHLGLYENVIKNDIKMSEIFNLRVKAMVKNANERRDETCGFVAGLWSMCSQYDLESVVLGSTVLTPLKPTRVFGVGPEEKITQTKKTEAALNAIEYFHSSSPRKPSIYECFKEMEECVSRTRLDDNYYTTTSSSEIEDANFLCALINKYGSASKIPAVKLWTCLDAIGQCFKNSLPVDWECLVDDWCGDAILNLKEGVPNIDETGTVFELSKFLGLCTRLFFGKCLDTSLGVAVWEKLLDENNKDWKGKVARAYEIALADTDVRSVENFINASNFLTNNTVLNKLKINSTPDEALRLHKWVEDEFYPKENTSLKNRAEWMAATENGIKEELSLSTVLTSVALFQKLMQRKCEITESQLVPLIRCFKITSKVCNRQAKGQSKDVVQNCIKETRFFDIENDPLYFYRFSGYVLGQIVNNDAVLEKISRRILFSFDFNGFDTSHWSRFLCHHFSQVLMGRRSRLLSRPLALMKNLVSATHRNQQGNKDTERVHTVMNRIANILLVKAVDSKRVTTNEILDCCILHDDDVTSKSFSEFWRKTRQEHQETKTNTTFNLASNSCTTVQLAECNKAARMINTNVSFHYTESALDELNDEEQIDPSLDPKNCKEDNDINKKGKRQNNSTYKPGNNNTNNTTNYSNNGSYSNINGKEDDQQSLTSFDQYCLDDRNASSREDGVFSVDQVVDRRIKQMLTQSEINGDIVKNIKSIKDFIKISVPFEKNEYDKYGISKIAMQNGIDAVNAWNKLVDKEAEKIFNECKNFTKLGEIYNMGIVSQDDISLYFNTGGLMSYFSDNSLVHGEFDVKKNDKQTNPLVQNEGSHMYWYNYEKNKVYGSEIKHTPGHGGRQVGHPLRVFLALEGKGMAETRVLASQFSDFVYDSYWSQVMPANHLRSEPMDTTAATSGSTLSNDDENDTKNSKKKNSKKNYNNRNLKFVQKTQESNMEGNCFMNKAALQDKTYVSLKQNPQLLSLYNDTGIAKETQIETIEVVEEKKDACVVLGGDRKNLNTFKCLERMWKCNNGLSPKNQINLFKKLYFKNLNSLWLLVYEHHVNTLCEWGCITSENIQKSFFSISRDHAPSGVVDSNPPLTFHHSRFLAIEDYKKLLKDCAPLVYLSRKYQKKTNEEKHEESGTEDENTTMDETGLASAVYGREVLSSCLDPKGDFHTSWMTNSVSVCITPGTECYDFYNKSSYKQEDLDECWVGKECQKTCQGFAVFESEVNRALYQGVFCGDTTPFESKRCLRLINYNKSPCGPYSHLVESCYNDDAFKDLDGDECYLLRDSLDARKLLILSKSIVQDVPLRDKLLKCQKDSMKFLAGMDKGYYIDSSHLYKSGNTEHSLFGKCAKYLYNNNKLTMARVVFNNWSYITSIMVTNNKQVLKMLVSRHRSSNSDNNTLSNQRLPVSLFDNGNVFEEKPYRCLFLANPVCPAKNLLKRAGNMRLNITNTGTALVSKIMVELEKRKTYSNLISNSTATPFRISENTSCISVDNNRYFLIDGSFLLGGRLERINLVTDLFTRCKLKAEKHTVLNSVFSSDFISAALATSIEGTTLGRGLAILEHVSYIKNTETTNVTNHNYWSSDATDDNYGNDDCEKQQSTANNTATITTSSLLTPPSVCIRDEDFIFLYILWEIAKTVEKYTRDNTSDIKSKRKNKEVDTTLTALHAVRKCYMCCVDQETGMPRIHYVYLLRGLMNFGGLCAAICSGDGEKAHHMVLALNSVAMNIASKTALVFVGTKGNNLKTTLVDLCKKSWFERFEDVNVSALNSSGDSTSSTQANLASFAGKKSILIMDEVGYQGSISSLSLGSSSPSFLGALSNNIQNGIGNNNNRMDLAKHKYANEGSAKAVFRGIDHIMTDSQLKICDRECLSNKKPENKTALGVDCKYPSTSSSLSSDHNNFGSESEWVINCKKPMSVTSFANRCLWWDCISGTVVHMFNESSTTFNMSNRGKYPFHIEMSTKSPWLLNTDAIKKTGDKPIELYGQHTDEEIKTSLYSLLGDYSIKYKDILNFTKIQTYTKKINEIDIKTYIESWKQEMKEKKQTSKEKAKKVYEQLVKRDDLIKWTVKKYTSLHNKHYVLSCTPASSLFSEEIISALGKEEHFKIKNIIGEDCLKYINNTEFHQNSGLKNNSGVLMAYHCLYFGKPTATTACRSVAPPASKKAAVVSEDEEEKQLLGQYLSRINIKTIKNLTTRSNRLSSILVDDKEKEWMIDDDSYISSKSCQYDLSLLDVLKKPNKYSFPKITCDGALILSTNYEDCNNVLVYIKHMIEQGKISDWGTFMTVCRDNNLLEDEKINVKSFKLSDDSNPKTNGTVTNNLATNFFNEIQRANSEGGVGSSDKQDEKPIITTDKRRKMVYALCNFRSDGVPHTINEVARSVAASTGGVCSPVTTHMLPGQFNSNLFKKMISPKTGAVIRGIHEKGKLSSITVTPIMMSNSYIFSFFVDEAMAKRIIVFPCDTQFLYGIKNEDVKKFISLLDGGMQCIHAALILNRRRKFGEKSILHKERQLEKMENKWFTKVSGECTTTQKSMVLKCVASLLPSQLLKHLLKNKVLELRDSKNVSRLEENTNTFFHLFTTLSLCSKTATDFKTEGYKITDRKDFNGESSNHDCNDVRCKDDNYHYDDDHEEDNDCDDDEDDTTLRRKKTGCIKNPTNISPLQMCQLNPKCLNTTAINVAQSRQGAWVQVNTLMKCIMFVDMPFVETTRFYGEDFNMKMHVVKNCKEGIPPMDIDWCIGMSVPNPDMDVLGYGNHGAMIGAGTAITKQLCDGWGSMDIRNIMYSCHHLHMLFELCIQISDPRRKLSNVRLLKENNSGIDYVSVLLVCMVYQQLMNQAGFSVFDGVLSHQQQSPPSSSCSLGVKRLDIPIFLAMVINKPLHSIRNTTNLGWCSANLRHNHSDIIMYIVNQQLGLRLNRDFLCKSCKSVK